MQNLTLVSDVALAFLGREEFDVRMNRVLALVGAALGVSRAHVFLDDEGGETTSNTHEWCAPGIDSQKDHLQKLPYASIPSWRALLLRDGRIQSDDISSLPEDLRTVLERQKTRSLLVHPLALEGAAGGFVGFDECAGPRCWREVERALLKTIAGLISNAYETELERRGLATISKELSQEQEALHKLNRPCETIHDELTGLYNRGHIFLRLREILAESARNHRDFCIAILDLDHFKRVNDAHGSLAGDAVLRAFGGILRSNTRLYDLVGRYGGAEFVIVSINTAKDGAVALVSRLADKIRESVFSHQGTELPVTFSCGIASSAECVPAALSVELLLEKADARLYKAKQEGRDRIES